MTLERKNGLRIGILNIGTFKDKAEEIVDMMKNRNIDILGISETRDKSTGRTIIHDNYVYFSSGSESGKHGVGIVVNEKVAMHISGHETINNRIIKVNVRTPNQKLSIVQVYAPQQGQTRAEKEEFFDLLQEVIDTCNPDEEIITMGDFNGHVGTERQGFEDSVGHFGIGD